MNLKPHQWELVKTALIEKRNRHASEMQKYKVFTKAHGTELRACQRINHVLHIMEEEEFQRSLSTLS